MTDWDIEQRLDRIEAKVDNLLSFVRLLARMELLMARELDDVWAAVERTDTVTAGMSVLLTQLSQVIRDNAGDPVALRAIAARLSTQADTGAAAILANTPVVEPPVEPPADTTGGV